MDPQAPSSRLILWAAGGGLVCTLLILSLNGMLTRDAAESGATTVGAIAFATVFAAPFLIVLSSLALSDLTRRRAVWLAAAILTLFLAVISLFSAGMIFLVVAGALAWGWWAARRRDTSPPSVLSSLLTLWLVTSFGAAVALLLVWRETPMCWGTTAGGPGSEWWGWRCFSERGGRGGDVRRGVRNRIQRFDTVSLSSAVRLRSYVCPGRLSRHATIGRK